MRFTLALIACLALAPLTSRADERHRDAPSALAQDTSMETAPDLAPTADMAPVIDIATARAEREAIGASKVPLERVVLDVEILSHAKTGHARCQGHGFTKCMPIASGIRLVKSSDGHPGGVDAFREPTFASAKLPEIEHRICQCAAREFARVNRGRSVQVAQRFYWLKGHAPELPAVTRSPFASV